MGKFTLCLKTILFIAFCIVLTAFSAPDPIEQYIGFLQKSFTDHYDSNQEVNQVKGYELNITSNGFCRYKRYFSSGKTEYFAFNLAKFKDLDYYGNATNGKLCIRTKGDDVIVQTYKDKGGDIDSMATHIIIPVKNMEPEHLNQIRNNLSKIVPKTP